MTNGTRRGWGVNVTPRPLFTPGKDPVPIVQEAGWAPGPVWTGAENLAPTGIRSPDRPARSQSLYRLSYPAHWKKKPYMSTDFKNPNSTKIFGSKNKTCPGKTGCRAMVALCYGRSASDEKNTEKNCEFYSFLTAIFAIVWKRLTQNQLILYKLLKIKLIFVVLGN